LLVSTVSSTATHHDAVATLRSSYAAIPVGQRVRLAKRTSNLFRTRATDAAPGLDASGLANVIAIDPVTRTADVQGMCTYESLVAATLARGLMPLVVPQLKTITLGGAVTGLGIESSSFRSGLPHESVQEMDILVGSGELITASRGQNSDLFYGFPNSYGSLGYAVRLRIELEEVHPFVALRHVGFTDLDELCRTVGEITALQAFEGEPVHFLDGVMFGPGEAYLTLGRWVDTPADAGLARPSDYTGQQIFYRSIRDRDRDCLTVSDYLWRWDTDWFWCSRAFGAQHPLVRRVWPARLRRSDVYHRLVGFELRHQVVARVDSWRGRPARERVVQDVEIPLRNTAEFLRWFAATVPMSPIWLCPLTLREPVRPMAGDQPVWPLYPLRADDVYVNVGFWGTVPIEPERSDGEVNRLIEVAVASLGGHKSLYSASFYDRGTFDRLYGGPAYAELKRRYDPQSRLTGMHDKVVGGR
jgi:FAD/FMN-containing dehydrogenase